MLPSQGIFLEPRRNALISGHKIQELYTGPGGGGGGRGCGG